MIRLRWYYITFFHLICTVVYADYTDTSRHYMEVIKLNRSMRVSARSSPMQGSGCAVAAGCTGNDRRSTLYMLR